MSQTLDTNVLLYATNTEAEEHDRAVALLEHLMTGPDLVILLWPTMMSYLRMATHPSIFDRPLTHTDALANVEALIAPAHVRIVGESKRFWPAYRSVSSEVPTRGNGIPDAHLVALMVDHGIDTIWSRDRDFRKYADITVRDPFADRFRDGFGGPGTQR